MGDLRSRTHLWNICRTRLVELFPELTLDLEEVDGERMARALASLPMHTCMPVIKTYLNSWATSTRYHEENRLTCVFGCSVSDHLSHYLRCEYLWQHISAATGISAADNDIMARLGLVDASVTDFRILACIFLSYHSFKFARANGSQPSPSDVLAVNARAQKVTQ